MSSNRRNFIKKVTAGTAGIAVRSSTMGMSARSYGKIIGANDRINVAVAGLGRRLGAFVPPFANKKNNVELLYLCDVMKSQREKAAVRFSERFRFTPAPGEVAAAGAFGIINGIFERVIYNSPYRSAALEQGDIDGQRACVVRETLGTVKRVDHPEMAPLRPFAMGDAGIGRREYRNRGVQFLQSLDKDIPGADYCLLQV